FSREWSSDVCSSDLEDPWVATTNVSRRREVPGDPYEPKRRTSERQKESSMALFEQRASSRGATLDHDPHPPQYAIWLWWTFSMDESVGATPPESTLRAA